MIKFSDPWALHPIEGHRQVAVSELRTVRSGALLANESNAAEPRQLVSCGSSPPVVANGDPPMAASMDR